MCIKLPEQWTIEEYDLGLIGSSYEQDKEHLEQLKQSFISTTAKGWFENYHDPYLFFDDIFQLVLMELGEFTCCCNIVDGCIIDASIFRYYSFVITIPNPYTATKYVYKLQADSPLYACLYVWQLGSDKGVIY